MTNNPLLQIARRLVAAEVDLADTIDRLLDVIRPDRYTVGVDDGWLDQVAAHPDVLGKVAKVEALKRVQAVVVRTLQDGRP